MVQPHGDYGTRIIGNVRVFLATLDARYVPIEALGRLRHAVEVSGLEESLDAFIMHADGDDEVVEVGAFVTSSNEVAIRRFGQLRQYMANVGIVLDPRPCQLTNLPISITAEMRKHLH